MGGDGEWNLQKQKGVGQRVKSDALRFMSMFIHAIDFMAWYLQPTMCNV